MRDIYDNVRKSKMEFETDYNGISARPRSDDARLSLCLSEANIYLEKPLTG